MPRYVLRLSYHGGPFRGFAPNEGVPTIGHVLRVGLERILQHDVVVTCAGRTDAGVHALAQVVHFDSGRELDLDAVRGSLNGLCKPDIVVSEIELAPAGFHARFSATERSYRYRVLNRRLPDPFRREFTWRVALPLDVDLMNEGGQYLVGTHDFSSFCRRQVHSPGPEPVYKHRTRTVRSVEWSPQADDEIHLVISASSFCQQMVRSITGLCVDVGLGRIELAAIPAIIAARDRNQVPTVAPPQGLFLESVSY